ncbi:MULTISPECIES: M24 family metallopeptidase [Rhizobium]|uniref:Aminopeptidase P family protein n=3 Tax=Rhizobium TaxID=379 RepID=A0A6P1CFS6_RHITR|nr:MULTISPECIES: Xaa-Pro peptidase family protein [Rhizobium]AGB73666.1 family M24 metallopeptidase [Rhizobium tropici CIAT 899]AYG70577.1 aminopeptidase P family protein [Rhizobium sp. CCGE531]ENN83951.1 family M24 metallopeptidase [Rhizobium freirei PRF 81]MBB4245469.1 Xaa-Pro aminopeptidase [Rhizobium tropici]MBB5596775.1 Xaa-Pro aminopeptidase [Rhizobium tropici]
MTTTEATPKVQPFKFTAFEQKDYNYRVQRVREKMAQAEIDVLLVTDLSNICYLTGFQTLVSDWYSCLILPAQGNLVLHVCDLEVDLGRVHTNVERIESIMWSRMDEAGTELALIIDSLNSTPKKIGLESRQKGLTPYAYSKLCSAFPNAIVADASGLVTRIRAVKSPTEITYMRKAGLYSVAGLTAAEAIIQEGITDNDIAAAASAGMIRAGSEYFSIDPIIRTGDWHAIVHSSFRRNKIKRGDPIIMEMSGVHERYNAPLYSTAIAGRASDSTRLLSDVALHCLETLYSNLKPRRTMRDVLTSTKCELMSLDARTRLGTRIVGSTLADYLTEKFRSWKAYPVGLAFPPSWPENSIWLAESDQILVPGMCFHACYSFRVFGEVAAGFGDSIAITEEGFEILTPRTKRLLEVF